MSEAFICDGVRSPIGRYGGVLSSVRTDDLAAHPIRALLERYPGLAHDVDEVIFGCANQAGEDNRNVARMAVLLSGLPPSVPGFTVNRLCGSGLTAVAEAARAIRLGEADVVIAGGVESMSRAPFVVPKASSAFDRNAEIYDTTIGWRFINAQIAKAYGTESMPETAENLARQRGISREDQDRYACRSQQRALAAHGRLSEEIAPVPLPGKKGETRYVGEDEHPRPETTLESLARLRPIQLDGTVTAGNASGVNDGSAALLIASAEGVKRFNLAPRARILGTASAGVEPTIMGIGPVPATRKLLSRLKLDLSEMGVIELNEAFAAQVLAVTRELGLADDDPRVNPNGGAIALGHPLGMTGARLALAASLGLQRTGSRYALCTLCVGVGQGVSMVLEHV